MRMPPARQRMASEMIMKVETVWDLPYILLGVEYSKGAEA